MRAMEYILKHSIPQYRTPWYTGTLAFLPAYACFCVAGGWWEEDSRNANTVKMETGMRKTCDRETRFMDRA